MRLIGLFAIWVGLSAQVTASELRVAVDIAPVHSIVAQVMGDTGRLDLIVPVGASPHDHAMRPSEAFNLSKADVVIWVGEGLTPWLQGPIATLALDARHIELLALEQTQVLPFRGGADFGTHSHGDDEEHSEDEGGDPHVWLDPLNAIAWAHVIADVLGELDPSNTQLFKDNADIFVARISATILTVEEQLRSVKGTPFIVFHDAFHGFENRFGIEARGAISSSDATAPSPKRVALVRDLVAAHEVKCVVADPLFNAGLVRAVAGAARIGTADAMGVGLAIGPDLYENLMLSISQTLVDCLGD